MSERKYPLSRPSDGNDPRFTIGLMLEVGAVLERHGFPALTEGLDVVELQQALFAFIYERPISEGRLVTAVELMAEFEKGSSRS